MNLTFIGSAVYLSMDIPDMFLAVRCQTLISPVIFRPGFRRSRANIPYIQLSKLLNYIQWNKTNNFVLATFFGSWTCVDSFFRARQA